MLLGSDVMRMCKRWDDTVKNTVSTTDHGTSDGDEACVTKDGEGDDNIKKFSGDNDAVMVENSQITSQEKVISNPSGAHLHTHETVPNENIENTKGCDDDENIIFDDGGISDTCLAQLQTVYVGLYKEVDSQGENTDPLIITIIITIFFLV
ncbi:hypothetical protein HanXRQr2_Chr01g0016601 [Helianthus annuus]|uniref:Uncharacterized protein n=1 Tax=Helianthus annuus TaxID=4232 RepID=A0A9K3P2Q6_HELAN|nr:hypothetical protein HanXRQr2_Chr01g0016601 [Helianthus annuus]KAJ0956540.1 hypothetical protein HanPSC8_Chr01g0016001 [Helianthus annuus]